MKPRHLALFVLASLAAKSAHAATFNFTNLTGGSWGTATNWNGAPTFAADDVLDFSTINIATNAITTLDANRTAGKLKFGDASTLSNHWTVNTGTAGALTLSTGTATPTIEVVDSRIMATVNAEIAGTQGFSKIGAGTLVLGGTNNYTGTTAITAGFLSFAVPAAIPATSPITVASGTTLALRPGTGGFTTANLDALFAGTFPNVTVSAGGRLGIDTTAGDFTYATNLAGTYGLTKIGSNKLTISGTNTYTGGTYVWSALNPTASTVDVSGDQSAANGGWELRAGATINFLAGSTVAVAGGKSIFLANESVATHTLNVAGTVTVAANGNNNTLSVHAGSVLNINSGAVWTQSGSMQIVPQQSFSTPIMNVNAGGSFTYAGTAPISLSSSINSNGGSATLNLNGGTFTTGKNFNNATAATATAGEANLIFSNGGTLKLSADIASLATAVGRPFNVRLGTGGGVIDTNGFSTTLDLDLADVATQSGSLTKKGEGTLTLKGISTYTGATTVEGGTLSVFTTDPFSDSAILSVATGATLNLNFTGTDTVGSFRINGVTQKSGVWGRIGSGAAHETSAITGDGRIDNTNIAAEFYWDGTGSNWAPAASWSYSITDPTNNPTDAPDATSLAIFGGSGVVTDQTVKLGGDRGISQMNFVSPVLYTFNGGGTNSLLSVGTPGTINLLAGAGGVTFGSATAGQQVLPTLRTAQTWTNASTAALTTVNGLALDFYSFTTAGSGNFVFGGGVTGDAVAGLRKIGSGSLTFNGTDTFAGDKAIDRGTVTVLGNQTAATGSWILRGYGDTGTTYNTAATTVLLDTTSTATLASDKTVQLGNTTFSGGFAAQTLNANGAITNNGKLFIGRSGRLNVGGAWMQNGIATVASQGGGAAGMTVLPGGSFTYASATQFILTTDTATNLTIDGGTFTTGVNIRNNNAAIGSGAFSEVILSNGGTLKLSAAIADLLTTAGANIRLSAGTGGGVFDTNGFSTTLNVPVSGTGGLTKAGVGTLTTTGVNSYTGNTTVSGGTLSLAGANLADGSSVTIASGAKLNLAFTGSDTIGKLTINGASLPQGTYSATTHPTFITGSGSLTVVPAGFLVWATNLGLSGDPKADFDKDGLADATEFVLGSDPKVANGSGITSQKSGANFVFTFSRADACETSDITVTVEAGTNLGTWPQVFQIRDTTANSSAGVVITENADAADTVVVTIPTNAAPAIFARLKVLVSGS